MSWTPVPTAGTSWTTPAAPTSPPAGDYVREDFVEADFLIGGWADLATASGGWSTLALATLPAAMAGAFAAGVFDPKAFDVRRLGWAALSTAGITWSPEATAL